MIETGRFLQQRYRIDKQIGQGGMGAVYVATDERFGSMVAIKETLCMDDNFRKAIEREARLLNSLKHSALPRVSDHFEEDEGLFLVMEYIPGDDVAKMLEGPDRSFPIEQVLKWADQLLDALDYLHNQELPVVHRDIKPQNLKLNSRGEMILLDFGLAKGNPTDASHHTAAKSIFGYSRNYASLEQIQGTGTDPRSDLYSLAATLYHLLTGVPPEDALTRAMSVLSQKPDPLVAANVLDPKIPAGVAGVLMKALDLNADVRPVSASEMRQMLRESEHYAYLANESQPAGTPSPQVSAEMTKIMPEGTRGLPPRDTEVKTEVMPSELSQVTSVAGAVPLGSATRIVSVEPERAGRGRRFAWAGGLLSLVLVGAAVAGGLYVVKPSVFGVMGVADNAADPSPPVSSSAASTEPVQSNVQTESSTLELSNSVIDGDGAAGAFDGRETAVPPVGKAGDKNKTNPGNKSGGRDKNIAEPLVPDDGEVVVTKRNADGTTTTTRVFRRPPANGQPPMDPFDPFPNGVDPRYLTPAQRRRLKDAMKQIPPRPAPTPEVPKN